MPLVADKLPSNKTWHTVPPMPQEPHVARVRWAVDLGLQNQRPYKGQQKPPRYEVLIGFEFQDFFMADKEWDGDLSTLEDHLDVTRPRLLSKRYKMYPNASRGAELEARQALDPTGKYGGDWGRMAEEGLPCLVSVRHWVRDDERVIEQVGEVMALPSVLRASLRDPVNPALVFDLSEPDKEVYMALPQWVRDVIGERINQDETPLDFEDEEEEVSTDEKPEGDLPW